MIVHVGVKGGGALVHSCRGLHDENGALGVYYMGSSLNLGPVLGPPNIARHIKKDSKRDPNLENYP